MINNVDTFIALVFEKFKEDSPVKLVCSKPRTSSKFQQAQLESFLESNTKIKISKKTKTQDFTSILNLEELPKELSSLLKDEFFFASLYWQGETWNLLQNKKGTVTVKHQHNKMNDASETTTTHNRQKMYLIEEDAPFLKLLHVSGNDGKVLAPMQKKYRQINRFVELVMHGLDEEKGSLAIADMGSGKGYLTFALYHHLETMGFDVKMTGYELRPELVTLCNGIVDRLSLKGLQFKAENIKDAATGKLDMLLALHACDIATDLAIKKALDAKAKYIIDCGFRFPERLL
ncbi:MAG TPA: SAM-dependent methyltransferase, partial [Saprospiraceae bacterium]|nr:SAM-dependent methyltransferase [Saprospiraceae bacterium]